MTFPSSNNQNVRLGALKKLYTLSLSAENRVSMGSKDLGLLPALMAVVSSDSGDARAHAQATLRNISVAAEVRKCLCLTVWVKK